jgi:hypothetical protein
LVGSERPFSAQVLFFRSVTKMLIMHCITPLFTPYLDENVLILSSILNLNILLKWLQT